MGNSEIGNVEVQLILSNEFGEYLGQKFIMSYENYQGVLEKSKSFYNQPGFELTCEDDTFVVFPPEVVKKSILKVAMKKIE